MKFAWVDPAVNVTDTGTVTSALDEVTCTWNPCGAGESNTIRPVAFFPPFTLDGVMVKELTLAGSTVSGVATVVHRDALIGTIACVCTEIV